MAWGTKDIPNQTGKVIVVTGANTGLGFETAKALAGAGAEVVLACRTPSKGEDAVGRIQSAVTDAKVSFMALDLSRLSSVREFADELSGRYDRLDVLVNNAGIMAVPLGSTEDGFESQIGTNHFGHFALTGLLLDRLLASDGSRIVNVSSLMHHAGWMNFESFTSPARYNKWVAYGQSKLANLLFTYEASRRLIAKGHSVLSVASHPGGLSTDLQRDTAVVRFITQRTAQSAADGALPSLYAAVAPDVQAADYFGPAGAFEFKGPPKKVTSNRRSHDAAVACRLWEVSEELTSVRWLS